jgi:EAL domain-containing protein (putative c-di-GMP-specific phosphodiesterase class I)
MVAEIQAHNLESNRVSEDTLGNFKLNQISQREDYNLFLQAINNATVNYQTIFEIHGQMAIGAEALLRTKTAYRSMTHLQIIEYAQEHGFVPRITEVVLKDILSRVRTTCRSLGAIGQYGNINISQETFTYTINISPDCLEDQVCIDLINQFLFVTTNKYRLILEMSERNVFPCDLLEEFYKKVSRDDRVKFAIDDFGVGQSRFENLNSPLVTWVKIDRSFLPFDDDLDKQRTFKAVVEFVQFFDCIVVIEGVETKPQYDLVSSLKGNILAQGYLLARPAP